MSVFLLWCFSFWAAAQVNPGADYLTTRTKNFHVHHTEEQTALAKKFAQHLEEALPILTKELAWQPDLPIDFVLNDRSDSANGFAYSFPFNKIEVFPVAYGSDSSLAEYHDWVRELAIHELTHIIANDTVGSFYKILRTVFGEVIKPNGMQPRWLVEGLAVYFETEYSQLGRGRSALLDSLLRTTSVYKMWKTGDYLRLDRLNDGVFWWPQGVTPYLVGYTIQAHLERLRKNQNIALKEPSTDQEEETATANDGGFSQSIPGKISSDNARAIPYFLDTNLKGITGINYSAAWASMVQTLESRYENESGQAYCQLSYAGRYTGSPLVGRDGFVYFIADHPDHGRWLARLKADAACAPQEQAHAQSTLKNYPAANFERLYKLNSEGGPVQIRFSPDQQKIAFTDQDIHDSINYFDDVFVYSLEQDSVAQITERERVRDAVFSEDGTKLYFVRILPTGAQSIEEKELPSGKQRTVFISGLFHSINGLARARNTLYFSYHNNAGQEEIRQLDLLEQNALQAETAIKWPGKGKQFFEKHAHVTDDGTIYYSAHYLNSETRGRFEIFRYRRGDPKPTRITLSNTGMMHWPYVKEEQLYATQYGLSGFNLVRIDLPALVGPAEKANLLADNVAKRAGLHEDITQTTPGSRTFLVAPEVSFADTENYSSFSTAASSLWPKYWFPYLAAVSDGLLAGAVTSGADPLSYHNYVLSAAYDSRASFPHYYANYTNKYFRTHLSLRAEQENSYLTGAGTSNRTAQYTFQGYLPMNYFGFSFGGAFREQFYFGVRSQNPLVFARLLFQDTDQTPSALAPNSGVYADLYTAYYPESSFSAAFTDLQPEFGAYFRGILPSHSIGLELKGGYTSNDSLASNYYLGGGTSAVTTPSFIVRGYPRDSLLGQKIATLNASYTFPLKTLYYGLHIYPMFLRSLGITLHADAGSANFVGRYVNGIFSGYQAQPIFQKILPGIGADLFTKTTAFFYAPLTISLNLHYGFRNQFGGDTYFFFGLGSTNITY